MLTQVSLHLLIATSVERSRFGNWKYILIITASVHTQISTHNDVILLSRDFADCRCLINKQNS
jgi:hypothetical protein